MRMGPLPGWLLAWLLLLVPCSGQLIGSRGVFTLPEGQVYRDAVTRDASRMAGQFAMRFQVMEGMKVDKKFKKLSKASARAHTPFFGPKVRMKGKSLTPDEVLDFHDSRSFNPPEELRMNKPLAELEQERSTSSQQLLMAEELSKPNAAHQAQSEQQDLQQFLAFEAVRTGPGRGNPKQVSTFDDTELKQEQGPTLFPTFEAVPTMPRKNMKKGKTEKKRKQGKRFMKEQDKNPALRLPPFMRFSPMGNLKENQFTPIESESPSRVPAAESAGLRPRPLHTGARPSQLSPLPPPPKEDVRPRPEAVRPFPPPSSVNGGRRHRPSKFNQPSLPTGAKRRPRIKPFRPPASATEIEDIRSGRKQFQPLGNSMELTRTPNGHGQNDHFIEDKRVKPAVFNSQRFGSKRERPKVTPFAPPSEVVDAHPRPNPAPLHPPAFTRFTALHFQADRGSPMQNAIHPPATGGARRQPSPFRPGPPTSRPIFQVFASQTPVLDSPSNSLDYVDHGLISSPSPVPHKFGLRHRGRPRGRPRLQKPRPMPGPVRVSTVRPPVFDRTPSSLTDFNSDAIFGNVFGRRHTGPFIVNGPNFSISWG